MPRVSESDLEAFSNWLARRGRSETSRVQYRYRLERLFEEDDPVSLLTDRKLSPCYRNNLAVAYRQFAKFKKDHALLEELDEIRLPAPIRKSAKEPLNKEEWHEVLDEIEEADYLDEAEQAVLLIIASRGIRLSDLLRVTHQEVKDAVKKGTLAFTGKGERRSFFSAQNIIEPLKALLEMKWPEDGVVANLISPKSASENVVASAGRQIRRALDRVIKKMGLKKGDLFAHKFRHTFVNEALAEMKGDPRAVFHLQDMMNWSSPNTARNYVKHADKEELDQVEQRMFSRRRK